MSGVKRPRNSVKDRPSRKLLLARKARKLLRPAAWVAFAAFVGLFIAMVVHSAAPGGMIAALRDRMGTATGMRVTDIVIQGRANTPEALLRAALGVSKGDAILGFSVEGARKRIETLNWIEQATVERRLPGTVVVVLQERRPFAIWQNQGKFVLIDRAGQIVANQDVAQFKSLPLVVGAGAPAAAAPLLDALTDRPQLQTRVLAAVRVAERRWNLRMKSGTDVMLPEGHEAPALDRLIQLQNEHAVLDRPLAAIDMRLADKLVLRPKIEPRSETTPAPTPVVARKPT